MPEARRGLKQLQSTHGARPAPAQHPEVWQAGRLALQVLVAHAEITRGAAATFCLGRGEGEDVEPVEHKRVEISGVRFRGRETGRRSKCNQGGPVIMQSVWSQTLETPTIV